MVTWLVEDRSVGSSLRAIAGLQAHLPASTSALLGVAALGAVTLPGVSLLTQYATTMAHEAAHAAMGSVTGQKVSAIALRGNGEGRTTLTRPQGAGFILAGVAGYLGPSLFGLGAAELIRVRHIVAVLWLALLALAILAVLARRSGFGLAAVIITGVLVYLIARYAPAGGQIAAAYAIAWLLLLSGVRVVLRHGRHASDAVALRQLTGIPRGLWVAFWLAGSAAALVIGGMLIV